MKKKKKEKIPPTKEHSNFLVIDPRKTEIYELTDKEFNNCFKEAH